MGSTPIVDPRYRRYKLKVFTLYSLVFVALMTLLLGCESYCEGYEAQKTKNITEYEITDEAIHLVNGATLDDPHCEVYFVEFMDTINQFEECTGFMPKWPCITVKVADNWRRSACTFQQNFPCNRDINECIDNGDFVSDLCPCSCNYAIQNGDIVVVTPDLSGLREGLARIVTGDRDPWSQPYAHCLHET